MRTFQKNPCAETRSLPRADRPNCRSPGGGDVAVAQALESQTPVEDQQHRSTLRRVTAIAASICSSLACRRWRLAQTTRAGAAIARPLAKRMAGAKRREGDGGLFLQAARDQGQIGRGRPRYPAYPDPAHLLGVPCLPDRRHSRSRAHPRGQDRPGAHRKCRDHHRGERRAGADRGRSGLL